MVPLAFGLLATARPALTLFVGQAYVGGAAPLMILSGIFGITVVAVALGPMVVAIGETRLASLITITTLVVSLVTAAVLTPLFGMLGAAASRGVIMILGLALWIFFLRKKMPVHIDLDAVKKSFAAGAVMVFAVMGLEAGLYSKYFLPAYVVVGGVVYLAMLRVLKAVRQDDIDLIKKYLPPQLAFASNLLSALLLPNSER
jgi:O-antigen/teichoic acid export membrane protein